MCSLSASCLDKHSRPTYFYTQVARCRAESCELLEVGKKIQPRCPPPLVCCPKVRHYITYGTQLDGLAFVALLGFLQDFSGYNEASI